MFPFLPRKEPLIGLDYTTSGLRIVQLQQTPKGLHLKRLLSHPQIEASWIEAQGLKGASVAFALPTQLILRKQLDLSTRHQGRFLTQEIDARLPEYFPAIAKSELYFDYVVQSQGEGRQQVLLVAVRKKELEHYWEPLKAVGFQAEVVDSRLYAIARGLNQQALEDPEALVLVDWDEPQASFLVFQDQELAFQYSWPASSHETFSLGLTKAIELYQHPAKSLPAKLWLAGSLAKAADLQALETACGRPLSFFDPFLKLERPDPALAALCAGEKAAYLLAMGLALRSFQHD